MAQIGFVGLGDMGGPMARHLVESGYETTVYARGEHLASLERAGATSTDSYDEVARRSDIVFLCLPGPEAVEEVVLGSGELGDGLGSGTVLVDTTTSLPVVTNRIATRLEAAGVTVFSAPISGGKKGAEAGELSVIVSGDPDIFEEIRDAFDPFSRNVHYVGEEPGQGHALKLVSNFVSFSGFLAASEGIALGRQSGIDMEVMLEVLNDSSGQNYATQHQFPERIATGTYDTGFPLTLLEKDLQLFTSFAEERGVPVLYANITEVMIAYARSHFGDDADMTRMYDFFVYLMTGE